MEGGNRCNYLLD